MSVVHPVRSVVFSNDGSLVYIVIRNAILVAQYPDMKYIGSWFDLEPQTTEKLGEPLAKKVKIESKAPSGEFIASSAIRNPILAGDKTILACADRDKSIVVLSVDLHSAESPVSVVNRVPLPKRPNALALVDNDEQVLVADKFGDVYKLSVTNAPLSDDLEPILGHVSMLTDIVTVRHGSQDYVVTSDRDEHIKISQFPKTYIVENWLFGHREFVSTISCPKWQTDWLFSAGGDPEIFAWDWVQGKLLSRFDYSKIIEPYLTSDHLAPDRFQNDKKDLVEYSVSKIIACESKPFVAFFVEATKILIILKLDKVSGQVSMFQTIELPHKIVSLSNYLKSGFCVTLDNRTANKVNFACFYSFKDQQDKFTIDSSLGDKFDALIEFSSNEVDCIKTEDKDIYPLYTVGQLRKHGEHYS